MECISADGRCLNPLIIWPTSTIRNDWTIHPTPGWHFACSLSGYSNRDILLEWFRRVFDPQTKSRANGRPRILINDRFAAHESLEVLQFCHKNNIILCRLPSHTSHKLQPCNIAVFGPLKTAYRDLVKELYRGGANTVGKQHFTFLYSQARSVAFTSRNIRSGWAKTGLHLFSPGRVLHNIQKPLCQEPTDSYTKDTALHDEPLQTPVTSEDLTSLRRIIEQNIHALDDHSQLYFRKLANAGEKAITARDLLFKENFDLFK
jgi:DDE superfamily endonuclease